MKKLLSDEEYYSNLPKKHIGVGVLIFNKNKQLLIVNPTYKEGWAIPGGGVDNDESPKEAAIREIKEEMEIDLKDIALLGVGYTVTKGIKPETLQFIFYGGELSENEINCINLEKNEHSEFRFVEIAEASTLLNERQKHWLVFCDNVFKYKGDIYLEA